MSNIKCTEFESKIQQEETILITIGQACKLLNIGRNTMLKLVKTTGFPALRLQRKNINR